MPDGPHEQGKWLRFSACGRYSKPGRPDLRLELVESVLFQDGLIVELQDHSEADAQAGIAAYLRDYGPRSDWNGVEKWCSRACPCDVCAPYQNRNLADATIVR